MGIPFQEVIDAYLTTEDCDPAYTWVTKATIIVFIRGSNDYIIVSTKSIDTIHREIQTHSSQNIASICRTLVACQPGDYVNFDTLPPLVKFYIGNYVDTIYGILDCQPSKVVAKTRRVKFDSSHV